MRVRRVRLEKIPARVGTGRNRDAIRMQLRITRQLRDRARRPITGFRRSLMPPQCLIITLLVNRQRHRHVGDPEARPGVTGNAESRPRLFFPCGFTSRLSRSRIRRAKKRAAGNNHVLQAYSVTSDKQCHRRDLSLRIFRNSRRFARLERNTTRETNIVPVLVPFP